MSEVRVARARLEEVQPLAREYRMETRDADRTLEPALPTGAVFWIARDEDREPLGYAAGRLSPEGLQIGPVYVRAAHRRAGVGQRLLAEIERFADGARIPLVEVSVPADNEAGVRFLESAGYRTRRLLLARGDKEDRRERR